MIHDSDLYRAKTIDVKRLKHIRVVCHHNRARYLQKHADGKEYVIPKKDEIKVPLTDDILDALEKCGRDDGARERRRRTRSRSPSGSSRGAQVVEVEDVVVPEEEKQLPPIRVHVSPQSGRAEEYGSASRSERQEEKRDFTTGSGGPKVIWTPAPFMLGSKIKTINDITEWVETALMGSAEWLRNVVIIDPAGAMFEPGPDGSKAFGGGGFSGGLYNVLGIKGKEHSLPTPVSTYSVLNPETFEDPDYAGPEYWVLHVHAPKTENNSGEAAKKLIKDAESAIRRALSEIFTDGRLDEDTAIILPLISTGIYGGPRMQEFEYRNMYADMIITTVNDIITLPQLQDSNNVIIVPYPAEWSRAFTGGLGVTGMQSGTGDDADWSDTDTDDETSSSSSSSDTSADSEMDEDDHESEDDSVNDLDLNDFDFDDDDDDVAPDAQVMIGGAGGDDTSSNDAELSGDNYA